MTTIVNEIIEKMQQDAILLNEMCGVYPGDPDNVMTVQALMLNKAAMWLMRINWETEQELFYENLPKVSISYLNDNELSDA